MPRSLLSACVLAFCLAAGFSLAGEPKTPKALYIGIDGTRFDALTKTGTPHLDGLIKQGIVADNCLILGDRYHKNDTISGPGWSTILTGVWADKHGVNDNSFKGKNYEKHPHFFALLKQAKPNLQTASLVTWNPIDEHIVSGADYHHGFADDSKEYARFDREATAEAVKRLAEEKLDCMFLYIGAVDETGHRKGFHPSVPEYIAAIEQADALVGQALAAVNGRESFARENWLIVVTSDHGGRGTGHSGGHNVPEILNSFLIVSGGSAKRGRFEDQTYLCDAPVTVMAHLGVPAKVDWKLDGKPVGLVAEAKGQ